MDVFVQMAITMIEPQLHWRIYYDDGKVYDNSYGLPRYAPKTGVQCVVVNNEGSFSYDAEMEQVGRLVLHDWEYYVYMKDTGWFGVLNIVDLVDHILHSSHEIECVLKARTVPTHVFKEIYKRAWNDPDFPLKSAIRKDEAPQHFGVPD